MTIQANPRNWHLDSKKSKQDDDKTESFIREYRKHNQDSIITL